MVIPEQHLDAMRAEWRRAARETVVITTPIEQEDGQGGYQDTGAVVTEGPLPCSKGPVGSDVGSRVLQERENTESLHVIYVPHDAAVSYRSTLVLNGNERFQAVAVVPRRTYQVKRRVLARYAGVVESAES